MPLVSRDKTGAVPSVSRCSRRRRCVLGGPAAPGLHTDPAHTGSDARHGGAEALAERAAPAVLTAAQLSIDPTIQTSVTRSAALPFPAIAISALNQVPLHCCRVGPARAARKRPARSLETSTRGVSYSDDGATVPLTFSLAFKRRV